MMHPDILEAVVREHMAQRERELRSRAAARDRAALPDPGEDSVDAERDRTPSPRSPAKEPSTPRSRALADRR